MTTDDSDITTKTTTTTTTTTATTTTTTKLPKRKIFISGFPGSDPEANMNAAKWRFFMESNMEKRKRNPIKTKRKTEI